MSLSAAAMRKKKKDGDIVKRFRGLFKRNNSTNDSAASQDSVQVAVSESAFRAHAPVAGNDKGSAELTASGKYIGSILLLVFR